MILLKFGGDKSLNSLAASRFTVLHRNGRLTPLTQVSALDRVAQTREKCLGLRWSSKYADDCGDDDDYGGEDKPLDLRVILDEPT